VTDNKKQTEKGNSLLTFSVADVNNLLASNLPACIATGVNSGLPFNTSPIA